MAWGKEARQDRWQLGEIEGQKMLVAWQELTGEIGSGV